MITSDISSDPAYQDLPDRDRMLLYRTILTATNGNIAGYFRVNLNALCVDMLLDPKTERKTLIDWLNTDTTLWRFDESTRQLLIPTYLKYNKFSPKSETQCKRMLLDLNTLAPSMLDEDFVYGLIKYCGPDSLKAVPDRIVQTCKYLYSGNATVKGAYINKYISLLEER